MFDMQIAEQIALETGGPLTVNYDFCGIEVRYICTSDMGWVIPVTDISKALGISRQTQSKILKDGKVEFEPFSTHVNLTLTSEQVAPIKVTCLTRDGITMFLMKLTPSRMADPEVGKHISEFQVFVVKTFGEYLDYVKIPQWLTRREAAKLKYFPMTDAIKDNLLESIPKEKQGLVYASEADMLNVIVFGKTAKEAGRNQRDTASSEQLNFIAKLEEINEGLIRAKLPIESRFEMLCNIRDDLVKHNRLCLPEGAKYKFSPYIYY